VRASRSSERTSPLTGPAGPDDDPTVARGVRPGPRASGPRTQEPKP
jgi:hypothetical protein